MYIANLLRSYKEIIATNSYKNICGMSCLILGVPFTFLYEIFILSYYNYPNKESHITLAIFLFFQVSINFIFSVLTDSSMKCVDSICDKSQNLCDNCNKNHLPRTHLCPVCNKCIIRRDHHCWFIGYCIGALNYRYFLCLLFYVWFTALYCNIYNFNFVCDIMENNYFFLIGCHLAPHFLIVTGCLNFKQSVLAIITFLGFGFLVIFTCLVVMQIIQFRKGQTKYERQKGITKYNHGFFKNLSYVIGDSGFIVLINPFVKSNINVDLQFCEI